MWRGTFGGARKGPLGEQAAVRAQGTVGSGGRGLGAGPPPCSLPLCSSYPALLGPTEDSEGSGVDAPSRPGLLGLPPQPSSARSQPAWPLSCTGRWPWPLSSSAWCSFNDLQPDQIASLPEAKFLEDRQPSWVPGFRAQFTNGAFFALPSLSVKLFISLLCSPLSPLPLAPLSLQERTGWRELLFNLRGVCKRAGEERQRQRVPLPPAQPGQKG